ncbi:hypothetical protein GGI12_005326, partial [Dipsacomyces acuminosporus]
SRNIAMNAFAFGILLALTYFGQQAAIALPTPGSVSSAGKLISYPPSVRTKPGSYIVEMEDGFTTINTASFAPSFASAPQVTIEKQFLSIFNGFSVKISKDFDPARLASAPGVKHVWPVSFYDLLYSQSEQNTTLPYLHQKTGVAKAIEEFGLTGKGIKIGIIDSGVDYNHPELGACWKTPGCPWQYGGDFTSEDSNNENPSAMANPDAVELDCIGHGTHVAGIIGAQGPKVYGVAPGATLGMYRVFGCSGSASTDVILTAIEAAYMDGHDIISLSLGGGGWSEDPLAVVCSNLTKKGVVVVAANGNDGSAGLYTSASPGLGHGVINVGSIENWSVTGYTAIVTTSQTQKSIFITTPGNEDIPFVFDNSTPVVAPTDSKGGVEGCSSFNTSLAGKIALISRGSCSPTQKTINAQNAGAVGVLIYNSVFGIYNAAVEGGTTIPVAAISRDDGLFIVNALSQGAVTIKAPKGETITIDNPTAGLMSAFSSYGPSPELDIAPLISGPGGLIYSTYPLNFGKYALLSGTSMSTPYISGTIALLKQARPGLTVGQIRDLLANSGKPLVDSANDKSIHPYWSGAGLVNIYDSITSRAIIDPPNISINDTNLGSLKSANGFASDDPVQISVHTVTIENTDGVRSATISFANSPADSLSSYSADGNFTAVPRVWPENTGSVDENTIPQAYAPEISQSNTIAPGQRRRITVFIIAPFKLKESDKWYYGGFLNFTLQWDGESAQSSYVVPYAGFNGNYRKLDVLSVPSEGYP